MYEEARYGLLTNSPNINHIVEIVGVNAVIGKTERHMSDQKKKLKVKMCAPRGFCAGVDCAIQIVEIALERYGAPVYVLSLIHI